MAILTLFLKYHFSIIEMVAVPGNLLPPIYSVNLVPIRCIDQDSHWIYSKQINKKMRGVEKIERINKRFDRGEDRTRDL